VRVPMRWAKTAAERTIVQEVYFLADDDTV
jgi:hypothetical protein